MHKKSKKVKTQESGSSLSFINVEDEVFQRVKNGIFNLFPQIRLIECSIFNTPVFPSL